MSSAGMSGIPWDFGLRQSFLGLGEVLGWWLLVRGGGGEFSREGGEVFAVGIVLLGGMSNGEASFSRCAGFGNAHSILDYYAFLQNERSINTVLSECRSDLVFVFTAESV